MKIAVVGAGISGLGAAWLLARKHDVRLFEANRYAGGHTRTIVAERNGRRWALDTGFMVFNDTTYPLLNRLFDHLGVAIQDTDMSFSVRCERCDVEYGGRGWRGIFAQRRNVARPRFFSMLADIARFNRLGARLAENGRLPTSTIAGFAADHRLGPSFVRHYLIPMASALWSSGTGDAARFPAAALIRFFDNHGFLRRNRLRWRSLAGGSHTYVAAMLRELGDRVHLGSPVSKIERGPGSVRLHFASGSQAFDHVVIATHADQALTLLAEPTAAEHALLAPWTYARNDVVVHTDPAHLPHHADARAAWNYRLVDCEEPTAVTSIAYHLNRLQRLEAAEDFVVTLNGSPPRPGSEIARLRYRHPIFTTETIATQPDLQALNGGSRAHLCGAYFGNGFHEDGFASGVRVANRLGVSWP